MRVEPFLEVRFSPSGVELWGVSCFDIIKNQSVRNTNPVSRVRSGLTKLLSDGIVACASLGENSVTLARLRDRNAMVVAESLELGLSPRVENPILDAGVGSLSLVVGLVPRTLDLLNKRVLVRSGGILDINAFLLEVGGQLGSIPVLVGSSNVVVPAAANELLQIPAVSGSWIGDIVVGQPSLKLSLVPLVVGCWWGL